MDVLKKMKNKLSTSGVVAQNDSPITGATEHQSVDPATVKQSDAAEHGGGHESIFSKVKHLFQSTSGGVDEYGVQKPSTPSKASKFLDYALPAATGIGLPLGLMFGRAIRSRKESGAAEDYQKSRKSAADIYGAEQKLGLGKDTLGETIRHNKATEGIGRTKAAAAWRPGEKERLLSDYLKTAGEMSDIRVLADKATEQQPLASKYSKRFDELQRRSDAESGVLYPKTVPGASQTMSKPKTLTDDEWITLQALDSQANNQDKPLNSVQFQQYRTLKQRAGMQ